MKRYELSPLQIELRKSGYTIAQVAEMTGAHRTTLCKVFKREGIYPEVPIVYPTRTPESKYKLIAHLYNDKLMTIDEIAKVMGCQPTNIMWHMRMGGIARRTNHESARLRRELRLGTKSG